ncbi:MAG: polysaccharide biosynthesis tyrosine autokinase, partial [Actinomycetota bacterium]|nr:polysaccharide biosynthesis tyrosine autokinase [Actinomycetota bacterium]
MSDRIDPPAEENSDVSERPYPSGASGGTPNDLRAYVAVLRRRKLIVVFVTLLTVGAAAFFSYRQTPTYDSTAQVLVKPLNPNQILQGYSFAISMETEVALASSPAVADRAAAILGDGAVEPGSISASSPVNTNFLNITYSAPSAIDAQRWAQAYAEGYIANREAEAQRLYDSQTKITREKLDALQTELSDAYLELAEVTSPLQRQQVQQRIDALNQQIQLRTTELAQTPVPTQDSTQLIAAATIPSRPSSPDWVRNLLLAGIAGVVLGVGVAFVREQLDDRMTGPEDMEEKIGAPAMAVVPHFPGIRNRKSDHLLIVRDKPKSPPAEAYRTVRTNIEFMSRTTDLKVLAIMSPGLGEGKTTTAANIAASLAAADRRVVLLGCDLRKPRIHKLFGLDNEMGLSDVLTDDVAVPAVAQRVPGMHSLRLIPSGPIPSNPAELLGSDRMTEIIVGLRTVADYVILDTAPVLAVADALALAPRCDGVLLVADASSTTRTGIRVAR